MADSKSEKFVHNNVNSELENKPKDCGESLAIKNREVMEPMLLEDCDGSKFPLCFNNVFTYCIKSGICVDKNDTMAIFIYIMMLEAGFVTPDYSNPQEESTCNVHSSFHYQRFLHLTRALPKNWKQNNVYNFTFILAPFTQHQCSITAIVIADDFVVNCKVKGISNSTFCMLIDPSMYVVQSGCLLSLNIYQNLKTLSVTFKNIISNSVKTLILDHYSLRSSSLQGLPPEILFNIFNYCDRNTINCIKRTCRYFEKMCTKQAS
ncbi:hypothetical protein PPYR_11268 [Photinus pyralis]|uniref:F-box domain-containing protein n=2 Tax=Photinus pyralis TaxID=7054 RepID=A0A1Y1KBF0_PHOPY|nr:F-box only protein 7-like isoform X1 [Photinus pyralis]KAB0794429.1 hypothetical protein PPYR_11268 [Photinus pyralis]